MKRGSSAKANGGLTRAVPLAPGVFAEPFTRVNLDFIVTPAKTPKIGEPNQSLICRKETTHPQHAKMHEMYHCEW
jgi:hypothetical protein